jgi:hypothetical protein
MWLFLVGSIGFWMWVGVQGGHRPPEAVEQPNPALHALITFFFGAFFLMAGVGAYFVIVFTTGLTFNFTRPIWEALKVKVYFANIIVSVLVGLGLGFGVASFLSPVLRGFGLQPGAAHTLPVLVIMGAFLTANVWVQIFAPLEKRAIGKRLVAQGITGEQLRGAIFVGLSNPASGFTKRFAAIEEDIGALWVGPDLLVYYGDKESFSVTRDQVVEIERRADNRSTTLLGGVAHVILHLRLADGGERQLRLHTEGRWTLGQKRKAMDALAASIVRWHTSGVAAPAA